MALTQIDDRGLKTPIDLIDNEKIRLGTGNDFELYHDGSNSYIKDTGTGNLYIFSENLRIENADGSESYIEANNGGNVELFWDGSKKLETTQYGAKISTNLSAGYLEVSTTGNLGDGHIEIKGGEGGGSILSLTADEGDDNADYWRIQNAGDNLLGFRSKESGSWVEKFRIQSDGRVQIPNDTGKYECGSSGDLQIYHNGTDSFVKTITGNLKLFVGNEQALIAKPNGAVELYFDDVKKLETTSAGTTTTGNATFTGHIYQGDNDAHFLGDGSDLQIFHDGSNSYIDNSTGELQIRTAYLRIRAKDDGEDIATFNDDAGVELFYDNTLRAATTANGFQAFGNLTIRDNVIFYIGDGNDLKIYHDGSNTYLDNATGDVYLRQNGTENSAKFIKNGGVELYYNDAKKMETLSNGVGFDGDSSACALRLKSDGSIRGYFYADANSSTGHLNNSGAWKFRVEDDGDYQFYGSSISDRDKKDNIATVTGTSLDKITKLVPKTYNWKNLDGITPTDKTFTGFIAQEVKEHLPSLVTGTDGQKNMAVDYNGILAYAVKAITELSAEVETLKTKVAALEAA